MGCGEQHLRLKLKELISAGGPLSEQPRQGHSGDTVFPRRGENHAVVLEGVGSGTLTQFVAFSGTTLQHLLHLLTTTVRGNELSVLQFWRIPNWLLSLTGQGGPEPYQPSGERFRVTHGLSEGELGLWSPLNSFPK